MHHTVKDYNLKNILEKAFFKLLAVSVLKGPLRPII